MSEAADEPRLVLPAALLLDLESKGGEDEGDTSLLYFYPDSDSTEDLVMKLKGMLLAIRGVSTSIAGQKVRLVKMAHMEANEEVLVSYVHLGGVALAMLLPAKLGDFLAHCLADDCSQLLQFALGPPAYWWGAGSCDGSAQDSLSFSGPEHSWVGRQPLPKGERKTVSLWLRSRLDMILQCYFMEIRGREWLHAHVVPAFELGVPYAAIPPDMQLRALELLNNVEVASAPAEERLSSPARFLSSRSSCLIHGGRLIASHMNIRETKEVWRMCWALSLYQRTPEHPAVILLQDAFLSEIATSDMQADRAEPTETPEGSDCAEGGPSGHVVLLAVGAGVDVVVVMLRPVGNAAAADLQGSFLSPAVLSMLTEFQQAESKAMDKLLATQEERSAAAGATEAKPAQAGASPRRSSHPSPTELLLLHHVSYNGVNGVLLSTDPPPGELASNLAGDFVATSLYLHSLFTRMRRCSWGVRSLARQSSALDDSPDAVSPFTPFSPFSNSPGPQWDNVGTPVSTRSHVSRDSPLSLSLTALINSAGSLTMKDGRPQRLGRADPTVFTLHQELAPLQGVLEVRIGLRRTDLAMLSRAVATEHEAQWWVTGRMDPSGRELFICHHEDVELSAVDMAFQISFGTFC
mmetsp:Transcript_26360/g.74104  ORF Transcript_26360/g.74104 Transcript_26360/m.74104 type:complete len:634 (-) Transcript_26360:2138-4039(-)